MVDGMDGERGAVTAGARGYYLLGPMVFLEHVTTTLADRNQARTNDSLNCICSRVLSNCL